MAPLPPLATPMHKTRCHIFKCFCHDAATPFPIISGSRNVNATATTPVFYTWPNGSRRASREHGCHIATEERSRLAVPDYWRHVFHRSIRGTCVINVLRQTCKLGSSDFEVNAFPRCSDRIHNRKEAVHFLKASPCNSLVIGMSWIGSRKKYFLRASATAALLHLVILSAWLRCS